MKKLLLLATLVSFGCEKDTNPTQPTNVVVNVTNNQNQNGQNSGAPNSPTSPSANCVAKTTGASCTLNANLVTTLKVGENCRLDTTPKDAAGNPLAESCASNGSLPTPSWGVAGGCNLTGNPNSFNPQLNALSAGLCSATVVLGSTLTATVTINVTN